MDPAILVIDLPDANFFCLLLFEGIPLHYFSEIKNHKEVTKQYSRSQGFFLTIFA
jgi:hypothetical protein